MQTSQPQASERLIFRAVVEAMLARGLRDRLTVDFKARLAKLGFDLDHILPGYPYPQWEAAVLEATSLFPELGREQALEELGRRMLHSTLDASPVASSLMPLLRVLGVTRAVKRSLRNSASENFNEVTFGAETKNSLEVHMSFVGQIPEFALGTLVGLVPMVGGNNVRGHIASYVAPSATYTLEWD